MKPLPEADDERMHDVLYLSALACCGGRWSDLGDWYSNHPESWRVPSREGVIWPHRLWLDLFDCWGRLFRKDGRDDLAAVGKVVAQLRRDQSTGEEQILAQADKFDTEAVAVQKLGMYHWAKATELLAEYMLRGGPMDVSTLLDKHFGAATKAFSAIGDVRFELMMRWLHVASRQMV